MVLLMSGGSYKVRNCLSKTYTCVLLYILTWPLLLLYSFPLFLHTAGANTPLVSATLAQQGREKTFRQSLGTLVGFIIVNLI